MPEMDCSKSSTLAWARYNIETRDLEVDFKGRDGQKTSTYLYRDVPRETWDGMWSAPSRGHFFSENIRTRHQGVKIWERPRAGKAAKAETPETGSLSG